MDISVITPVYNGNKYLNHYMKMMNMAVGNTEALVEVILVNDSPSIDIEFDRKLVKGYEVRIVENEINSGIHASRVHGLKESSGRYILFLDQDDLISEHSLETQYAAVKDADVVLGNGLFEINGKREKIFGNRFSQRFATHEWVYKWIRDFIVSPGQCLIKKSSIPEYWKNNTIKNNGTDDYLLWLLMFNNNMKMVCNYNTVYLHRNTGVNISADEEKMTGSTNEMLKILENYQNYNRDTVRFMRRRIEYKKVNRNNKKTFLMQTLKNIDIFMVNLLYRLLWRGCIIR